MVQLEESERIIVVTRHLTLVRHVCPVCGSEFTGPRWRRYDTIQCARRADYARHAEARRKAQVERYHRSKVHPEPGGIEEAK